MGGMTVKEGVHEGNVTVNNIEFDQKPAVMSDKN